MHGSTRQVQETWHLPQVGTRLSYLVLWSNLEWAVWYRYYSGEKKAPILTIVIGGNHEASNYMWELCVLMSYF